MIGLDSPNEISALVALAIMALVTRGYAPLLRFPWRSYDYASLMACFIAGIGAVICARLGWWDVLRPILGHYGYLTVVNMSPIGQVVNTVFNVLTSLCGLIALGALHRSLPDEDRQKYNWFTAPFYPGGAWLYVIYGRGK